MIGAVLPAFVLGLFAGMAPGPYTTMVVATALERGFRSALPLAMAPFITDVLPMVVTTWILTSLDPGVVTVMGWLGGGVIVALGVRLLMRHGGRAGEVGGSAAAPTIRFWHVVSSTLVSPAPWLFWLGVASPFLVRQWALDWRYGAAFVAVLFATNVGSASGLAWLASHGARVLAPYWRSRVLRLMGAALIVAGVFIIWQAARGDLTRMQSAPGFVDELLNDSAEGM